MLTLTLVGDSGKIIQRRMNKMIERLRTRGFCYEWVWKVECYWPSGEHGHHLHAFYHGDVEPSATDFQDAALAVGFGVETNVRSLIGNAGGATRYLWSWSKKAHEIHPLNIEHHLGVNGGRLMHASRNFWRVGGQRVSGMDSVLRGR